MRDVEELLESGLGVLDRGFLHADTMYPLFSGGHDSLCAVHLASQHPRFSGEVHHIDTGIGAAYTRQFVERVCSKFGWKLNVYRSPETYEKFVRERGFPGPGRHGWVYNRLKDRCVRMICKGRDPRLLVTGCRSQESVRRMGHVEPIKIGEMASGKVVLKKRIWVAPCHDWSKAEQQHYLDEMGLPINKLKVAIGMSGECFCGAFAQQGEIDLIRQHAPDVAAEIERLTAIASECGKHCTWGTRPPRSGKTIAASGPLCSSCDQRLAAIAVEISCR